MKQQSFFQSVQAAWNGICAACSSERNFRIHCFFVLIVVILGLFLKFSRFEWIAVCFAIGLVLSAELLNSAIEATVDLLSPDFRPLAGRAKDLAAAAVLISAIAAVIVGLFVFTPHLWNRVQNGVLITPKSRSNLTGSGGGSSRIDRLKICSDNKFKSTQKVFRNSTAAST